MMMFKFPATVTIEAGTTASSAESLITVVASAVAVTPTWLAPKVAE